MWSHHASASSSGIGGGSSCGCGRYAPSGTGGLSRPVTGSSPAADQPNRLGGAAARPPQGRRRRRARRCARNRLEQKKCAAAFQAAHFFSCSQVRVHVVKGFVKGSVKGFVTW